MGFIVVPVTSFYVCTYELENESSSDYSIRVVNYSYYYAHMYQSQSMISYECNSQEDW